MVRHEKIQNNRPTPKIGQKAKLEIQNGRTSDDDMYSRGPVGLMNHSLESSTRQQLLRLSGPHLQSAQRCAIAGSIGQVSGNRRLQQMLQGIETQPSQRLVQREDGESAAAGGFQLSSPSLTLPGTGQPSLSVGSLQLDPTPFTRLPIENNFSPGQLLQPSPALVRQLVDNWVLQYRLTHPGPAMTESAWQQLWSAWRRLADEWLARGADAPLNAELAQDLLRDQAARAVQERQPAGGEVSASDIAGQVWPAFERALEATRFYPQIRQNAEGLIQQHWPMLIPALGTALGASVGMGVQGNDWRALEQLSSLLPMLSTDIRLNDRWSLSLGFAESQPTRGGHEEGVVIGVNPSIGLNYRSDTLQFSVEGSVDLRFQTGQESTRGFQVQANPGAQATFRF